MLKQNISLEVKINDRAYQLLLPQDSPLGEVHDALFQMRSYIVDKINEAVKKDIQKEPKTLETE